MLAGRVFVFVDTRIGGAVDLSLGFVFARSSSYSYTFWAVYVFISPGSASPGAICAKANCVGNSQVEPFHTLNS